MAAVPTSIPTRDPVDAPDLVDVFRRSHDIDPHLDDIIQKHPKAVWFQSGIVNDRAARKLAAASH
jgi:predicted CoA-binding protein